MNADTPLPKSPSFFQIKSLSLAQILTWLKEIFGALTSSIWQSREGLCLACFQLHPHQQLNELT